MKCKDGRVLNDDWSTVWILNPFMQFELCIEKEIDDKNEISMTFLEKDTRTVR